MTQNLLENKSTSKINPNIFIILVSILIVCISKPDRLEIFDHHYNFIISTLVVSNVIIFLYTTNSFVSSWVRYDVLFLFGYIIVHFQIPYLASIGIEPEKSAFVWINKMLVNYATWLSTLAVLFWMLGFLLCLKRNSYKEQLYKTQNYRINTNKIDVCLAILFFLFITLVGERFLKGEYDGGDNWGVGANYAFLLLRILLYLRIIYIFIDNKDFLELRNIPQIIINNKAFLSILFLYLLIFLSAGDRGPVMEVAIIATGAYSIYKKGISLHMLILLMLIGASVFTVIRFGRSREVVENRSILVDGYNNMKDSEQTFNITNELAQSNRILYRALDVVPNQHPYLYGTTMIGEVVGVIPLGGSTFLEITRLPDMYKSSSYFFTIIGQGNFFSSGEGSEIIADIYINCGIYGVFILMFIFGYFVSFTSLAANMSKKHLWVIVYLFMLAGAIYINRSSLLHPLKQVCYALLIDRILSQKIYIEK